MSLPSVPPREPLGAIRFRQEKNALFYIFEKFRHLNSGHRFRFFSVLNESDVFSRLQTFAVYSLIVPSLELVRVRMKWYFQCKFRFENRKNKWGPGLFRVPKRM